MVLVEGYVQNERDVIVRGLLFGFWWWREANARVKIPDEEGSNGSH